MVPTIKDATLSKRPLLIFCDTLVNLGDLALLAQSVAAGRSQGRQVYVRQWSPPPPVIARQVEALGATIVSERELAALLRLAPRCDAVIGGGQMVRGNVSLPSLIAMIWTLMLVRLGGGRVSGWGMGVGPVRGRLTRSLWRLVFRPGERIAVRDARSLDHARRLFPARTGAERRYGLSAGHSAPQPQRAGQRAYHRPDRPLHRGQRGPLDRWRRLSHPAGLRAATDAQGAAGAGLP
jgi:hypothetical protein